MSVSAPGDVREFTPSGGNPNGVVVLGPAWVACGSYEVFRRQMECCRSLGFETFFLAVGPTFAITENHAYWNGYYSQTLNLEADFRGHTGRSEKFWQHPELVTELLPGTFRSAAFWKTAHTQLMDVPESLRAFIASHDVGTVICHHFFNIPLARKIVRLIPGARLILETQDVQTRHYLSQGLRHPITRRVADEDGMLRDEMRISAHANILIHYNDVENEVFARHLPRKQHVTVYPAFPRNYLKPLTEDKNKTYDFLIVASANDPNYRSVKSFLEEVWIPHLAGKRHLRILGNIDWLFRKYNDPLVELPDVFVGMVPDLTPYYQLARCVVLPVLEGQGIAIKTVEALSYGKPVVAMPLAYRGFRDHVPPELAAEIVTEPQEFADRLLACDPNTFAMQQDPRTIALYEKLFTVEKQTEIYRKLLVPGDARHRDCNDGAATESR